MDVTLNPFLLSGHLECNLEVKLLLSKGADGDKIV